MKNVNFIMKKLSTIKIIRIIIDYHYNLKILANLNLCILRDRLF